MAKSAFPCLTVDFSQNRVRVYKHTLHLLSDPQYIRFLINPEERYLGVQIASNDDTSAHRVGNRINKRNCVEIHSMSLLDQLQECTGWEKECSYTMHALANVDNSMIVFKWDDAMKNEKAQETNSL